MVPRNFADIAEQIKARDETRVHGYERRPATKQQRDEAERLNRGFEQLEAHENGEDVTTEDD